MTTPTRKRPMDGSKLLRSALLSCTALTSISLAATGAAVAQQVDNEDEANQQQVSQVSPRETISVTATRRETSVQEVPYNISAVSGDSIKSRNLLDSSELLRSIPGIALVDRGFRNAGTVNTARIRGINVDGGGLGDFAVAAQSTLSTYVNETPLFANFLLQDLERVEVLRGPQGTLYGNGALSGTVRYITRKPELDEFSGNVGASVSNTDASDGVSWAAEATLNVPLSNKAAVRITGARLDYAGLTDYVNVYVRDDENLPLAPDGVLAPTAAFEEVEDADWVEVWFVRGSVYVEPTEWLDLTLTYAYQTDDVGGRRAQTVGQDGFGRVYQPNEIGSVQLEPSSREVHLASLEVNMDLGFATLTSSTSYYDHSGDSISENTGFYAQAGFLAFYYNYPRPLAEAFRSYDDEAFIQELRLVSNTEGPLDYVVGLYYQDQDIFSSQDSYVRGFKRWFDTAFPFAVGAVGTDNDFIYRRNEDFMEIAAYGELTYHVTPRFRVTGGLRYFHNDSEVQTLQGFPTFTGLFPSQEATFENKSDDVLFKGNLAYDVTDQDMAYFTVSEGYRRGGSNAVPTSGFFAEDPAYQTYIADKVLNYEFGIKGTREAFAYSISLFYDQWKNPQLNTSTPVFGFFAVANGDRARSYGIEIEFDGYIGERFHYQIGYAYVNAKLSRDFFLPDGTLAGLDGADLPGSPDHMINVAFDYTQPIGNAMFLIGRIDGYYQSSSENSVGFDPRFAQRLKSFSIWNASLTFSMEDLFVTLWVKNIFNTDGVTGVFTEQFMGTLPAAGYFGNGNKELITLPRTFGLSASFNF